MIRAQRLNYERITLMMDTRVAASRLHVAESMIAPPDIERSRWATIGTIPTYFRERTLLLAKLLYR